MISTLNGRPWHGKGRTRAQKRARLHAELGPDILGFANIWWNGREITHSPRRSKAYHG